MLQRSPEKDFERNCFDFNHSSLSPFHPEKTKGRFTGDPKLAGPLLGGQPLKYDFVESATETVENSTQVQHLIQKSHFTCAEYKALIIETLLRIGQKNFSRDWEYLQQTELNSASSYPRSESTAVVNYFHQLKYMNVFGTHKKFRIWKGPNMT